MRYKVHEIFIRSENAAKSSFRTSKYLWDIVASLPESSQSLNFGCGKLRYYHAAMSRTQRLTLVNSTVQIDRHQQLLGEYSTVKALLEGSNSVSILTIKEFLRCITIFDRAYCINVLSVIPIISIREMVVKRLFDKMAVGATALFAVQYRNSEFTKMLSRQNAQERRGGILMDSLRGYSYYALISPEELRQLVYHCGFRDVETRLNEGSAYVLATK